MNKNELLTLCKYYKEDEVCPFLDGEPGYVFWAIEKKYIDNVTIDEGFHAGIIATLQEYIDKSRNKKNVLTDGAISIDKRAIIFYVDAMISKWMPYDEGTVFLY